MAPRDVSEEAKATPDPVEKGFATLATLRYIQFLTIAVLIFYDGVVNLPM